MAIISPRRHSLVLPIVEWARSSLIMSLTHQLCSHHWHTTLTPLLHGPDTQCLEA